MTTGRTFVRLTSLVLKLQSGTRTNRWKETWNTWGLMLDVSRVTWVWTCVSFLSRFFWTWRVSLSLLWCWSERGPRGTSSISSLCSALCSNSAMTAVINLQSEHTHTHTHTHRHTHTQTHTHRETHYINPLRLKQSAVSKKQTMQLGALNWKPWN